MIQISGLSAAVSSLDTVESGILARLGTGLIKAAEKVIADSVQLTPVDTGELRARAFTDTPSVSAEGIEISLGYEKYGTLYPVTPSGSPEEYAVFVHERTDVLHAAGQAKFLETALKEFEPVFLEYLKEVLQK